MAHVSAHSLRGTARGLSNSGQQGPFFEKNRVRAPTNDHALSFRTHSTVFSNHSNYGASALE